MYLKGITASGFKSFADKIEFSLNDGITGIVGPNGSGKSNVVDAVRWVLGEQSVKSLRGDGNMTDVIFSGSKSRKAMNVASVTLIFDNSDSYLPLDFNEISITRRVYKDGTNEYSINNNKCRLKDITDLLLDSGIAKESFNIISQGKIEEIISSKPETRRTIFEEAAGVLKYKKRKDEALRKLERTHDNMNRIKDIIHELELRINPLREQRDKALIYLEKQKELENIEIALITNDITNLNFKYQEDKKRIEELNEEILNISTNNSSSEAKIEEYKVNLNKLDLEVSYLQKEVLEKTSLVEKINSRKNILLERKKYEVEDTKLHNNLIELKEKELKIQSDINTLKYEINNKKEELNDINKEFSEIESLINKEKENKISLEKILRDTLREKNNIENNINYLKETIENNKSLPSSVKAVLSNPKLSGICDAIGSLIEVEEKYATAITTSLGFSTTYVVTENENSAKEAIQYLKNNNLGRVTFFPLNIIKSKFVDNDTLNAISSSKGFIDLASNLVKNDSKYNNIIENQLGNVIVVDNIDNANDISRKINHKYKIVTLDGELLHIGGSLTGGTLSKTKNIITEKYELEENIRKLDLTINKIKDLENKINDSDYNYRSLEDKLYIINRNKINSSEYINNKNNLLLEFTNNLDNIEKEIIGTNNIINNNINEEEEKVLKEYYFELENKKKLDNELELVIRKRDHINNELEEFEFSLKRENSIFNSKNKELKDLEIEVNRIDVKLDNLLNILNETYNMTYERAIITYKLEIEDDIARNKVSNLKREIKELGNINVESIEEFEEVNTRYEFLNGQREDLINAENTLLEIIHEMDDVMKKEFSETFKIINDNFKETFKELFKGGNAFLKLTDPDNILETGVEIVASPPGKKLTSISLLSGGEKTFTAISLLFAILKSRPVPFCILDEVEAALDEVNVDSFGKYLIGLKEKTQFILITHKKRTMEYVDTLYGVTMQESGVSKLVSVKMEEIPM